MNIHGVFWNIVVKIYNLHCIDEFIISLNIEFDFSLKSSSTPWPHTSYELAFFEWVYGVVIGIVSPHESSMFLAMYVWRFSDDVPACIYFNTPAFMENHLRHLKMMISFSDITGLHTQKVFIHLVLHPGNGYTKSAHAYIHFDIMHICISKWQKNLGRGSSLPEWVYTFGYVSLWYCLSIFPGNTWQIPP